jgi:hypothetical protein
MDVGQVMTREEIYEKFDSEWVLVGDPETEENLLLIRGRVLWHGTDKDEMYRAIDELSTPWRLATLYTGRISEEAALAYKFSMWRLSLEDAPA